MMDRTNVQNGFHSQQVQGVRVKRDPVSSSEKVTSGSSRSRRYGRTAVPVIRIQDTENNNPKDKALIAESCHPDKDAEREQTAMGFNIVVSPTKLVSLSKSSFILDKNQSKKPSDCEEVKTDDHNLKVSKVEATEAESPIENKSNSVSENRGLSPVYHRVPDLEERKQSLTNLMHQDSMKRRDSVAAMPTSKSCTETAKTHRRLSLGPTPAVPRRRSSVKDTLSSYYVRPADTANGNYQDQVTRILENLSENHLKVGLDNEDFKTAQIRKGKLDVSIPVLHVVKDDRELCITDIMSIEECIYNDHPELTILKISSDATEENGNQEPRAMLCVDQSDKMHEKVPGNSLTVIAEDQTSSPHSNLQNDGITGKERKISIRTCVNCMKEDKEDYAKQLQGCKNVGTFAAMETVQVLLSRQEAVRCVLEAMRTFQDKEELQLSASQSLLMMTSASEANCYIIQQNQGIPVLLNTLKYYSENVQLVRTILNIICYISSNEDFTQELLHNGCHSYILGAMSQHAADNSIIKQCLFTLGNIVTRVETAKQIMLVGGIHTVIALMANFTDDPDIMDNGSRAIGSFAAHEDTCLDVGQAGGTRAVLDAMTSSLDSVCVMESACWALACLTTMADLCQELHDIGGVATLLSALEENPDEESIQACGIRTICNLAVVETTVQTVSTERVLSILRTNTLRFPDNVELQGHIMFGLGQMALSEETIQACFLRQGGVRSVVYTMELHPEDIMIQENGCMILGNLAVNESIRRHIEDEGASKAVIAAMLYLDTRQETQQCACMALMNLTANFKDNKIRVMNNGGVMALLTCLRNFHTSPTITLSVLKTLGNIIELDEACRQTMDEYGLKTIVDVAMTNKDHHEILVFAALILCDISELKDLGSDDVECIDRTAISLLFLPTLDADLVLFACQTMEHLLSYDMIILTFIAEKRIDLILKLMQRFNSQPEILQCCCKIIATMSLDKRVVMPFACARGVVGAMKTYRDYLDLQIVGCGALLCLCEHNPALSEYILDEHAVVHIADALSHHSDDARLHAVALMTIANLCPVDSSSYPDQFHGVHDLVLSAMARFPENTEIQMYSCNVVARSAPADAKQSSKLLAALKNSLKRQGRSDRVYTPMAKALMCFWKENKDTVTRVLESNHRLQSAFAVELRQSDHDLI